MYLYLEISLKPAVFSCLTNTIVPLPIALESCSNPQKISASFLVCNEKKEVSSKAFLVCSLPQKDIVTVSTISYDLHKMLPAFFNS